MSGEAGLEWAMNTNYGICVCLENQASLTILILGRERIKWKKILIHIFITQSLGLLKWVFGGGPGSVFQLQDRGRKIESVNAEVGISGM